MVHRTNRLSGNDAQSGISNVPTSVNTGLLRITRENVGQFLKR